MYIVEICSAQRKYCNSSNCCNSVSGWCSWFDGRLIGADTGPLRQTVKKPRIA